MRQYEWYFQIFLVVFLIGFFIYLLLDFLFVLLLSSSVVFLLYKPYLKILSVVKSKNLAALLVSILLIAFVFIPGYLLVEQLVDESRNLVTTGVGLYENFDTQTCISNVLCNNVYQVFTFLDLGVDQIIGKFGSTLSSSYNMIFSSLWNFGLDLIIFMLSFFFLLKDGDKLVEYIRRVTPMKDSYKDALFIKFRDVSAAIFLETLFIALVQGSLTGIGLYFAGFGEPVFWGVVATFLSLLPFFGSTLVWAPAGLYLIANGEYITGGGLLLFGLVIISTIDNVLRPILIRSKVEVHSFITFLAILGGISAFGFYGIFFGPLVVSLLITVIQLYRLDFH